MIIIRQDGRRALSRGHSSVSICLTPTLDSILIPGQAWNLARLQKPVYLLKYWKL